VRPKLIVEEKKARIKYLKGENTFSKTISSNAAGY
jgi:hypothetical protein